jgi:spore coat protein U-like protein
MPVRRLLLGLILLILETAAAHAQSCSFSNTGINFGNVNLVSGGFQTATGTFTASCTGIARQAITICPNFNAGSGGVQSSGDPRYLVQGSYKMEYNLFRSNGVGQVWGSYTWSASPRPPSMSITLSASGSGSASQTIYGRLYNQQSGVPTGTFSSVFSGANTQIDYGYSSAFSCGSTLSPRVQNVPFTVRTTNNSSCSISTMTLDFGSQPNLNVAKSASNIISITCTAGTLYDVGLSNGVTGTGPTARKMTNTGTSQAITYGIYRNSTGLLPWGSTTGVNTVSSVGTGLAQSFQTFGIVPAQTTPPSLTYTDTVVVTVTY